MTTTCIIPSYNESLRLPYVLTQLSQVPLLTQLIVVNDGSSDNTSQILQQFPHVLLLNHPHNLGKTAAVKTGLTHALHNNILLFDADIAHFTPEEVTRSIQAFTQDPAIDMLVYRTIADKWPQKLVRADLVLSGERLLRRQILTKILQQPLEKFQLEIAINHFMLSQHKKIVWMPFTGLGPHKVHKFGLSGIIPDLQMYLDLFRYRGVVNYFLDLIQFSATQI
ncbi:hypothetical protein A2187_00085 [Candidatus Collierbacteria bacterium RIFOXYA1_FULL_46_24]|uniref:Glycosyltransferase 2-like domain-containing protein n=1 Tax=Candidatus Collierbacteria bacterium RIFOXYD1_FULL_46_26 TaxID=1817732 RepID=A0A1F5FX38_9BACT|nr:MAG: Glycosyl transferase family protein [Microgenomates group bacterium GW2011_GWF1_46_12]KKU27153.1 MAG: Glycosyl transferase family protein [Microgenomates group bacterium GW2011_GWF2_46_18]KKU44529.1 MAG: Glycosyl transferase family protein [Microgenomates group bacterium GW2011_GWB1_46_7]OGD70092.1 MAG: hypothetical protein A2187_00085 [Candidatus Collierbacteria bacterium RIFOXYA1_FULL_46_24]OGD84169.1 MAG: hypothetical protein A2618_00770 [Candidatus Collierbacteria bacterium RIFOXYD1